MSEVSNLAPGTWEEAEALVGRTLGTLNGADAVTVGDIRRKLEVLGLDCPLHYDEACAQEHGYETIVSPVSMMRVWAMPAYWEPGQPRIGKEVMTTPILAAGIPGRGDTLIAARVRNEYLAPIYPGDHISAASVLQSVTQKTTRVGPGAFLVVETTYSNQRGEDVGIETATLLRYTQRPAAARTPKRDSARADVSPRPVGEQLPPFPVTLTLQRLVMEAGANRDFAPIHFDPEAARGSGAPDVYANTTFAETLIEALIRSWAGLAARITAIEFSMTAFNCVGDEIEAQGVVTNSNGDGNQHLDVWVDGPRGRTLSGTASVAGAR